METDETLDTGQNHIKQKKFVSTKQKIAARKANGGMGGGKKVALLPKKPLVPKKASMPPNKNLETIPSVAIPLIDNDPGLTNFTLGSATNRLQPPAIITSEVRRPGWNRSVGIPASPLNVFGADQPGAPPSRNIRMLKIGLGVLGGIALLLGSFASILYISKKHRKDKRRNRNRKRGEGDRPPGGPPGGPHAGPHGALGPHGQYPPHGVPPCNGEYSQYPPNGWQNSLNPYAPMHNYTQLPFHGQLPNPAYYGVPYENYGGHYPVAPVGFYPHMGGYPEMAQQQYYQYCDAYGQPIQYPESQGDISEVGFDPVLNYVETLGDELKTPKRRPKQRKEGSSTPHPIITRRASCKSVKSEVSAWTEDEETSKADNVSTYVSQENVSLKGSHSGKEETKSEKLKLDGESTKSSPQLSQTNDSAYGSRGSIQSPNRSGNPLAIPPYATRGADGVGFQVVPVQNVPVPVVPKISQYMVDPYNHKMLSMSATMSQYSSNGHLRGSPNPNPSRVSDDRVPTPVKIQQTQFADEN